MITQRIKNVVVKSANLITRGPNNFLVLTTKNNTQVFVNEWWSADAPPSRYRQTGIMETHFGVFTKENVKEWEGCTINHASIERYPGMFFNTMDLEVVKKAPKKKVKAKAKVKKSSRKAKK